MKYSAEFYTRSRRLYHLSATDHCVNLVGVVGFEPTTLAPQRPGSTTELHPDERSESTAFFSLRGSPDQASSTGCITF